MNWLNKLERKLGRYAIPNLMLWLIGAYGIGFILAQVAPGIFAYLLLSPYHILHGQIWRLVTWIFMPTDSNLFSLVIMAIFYYQLGTTLERNWGTFRFNVYIFGGMLFTVLGAFILYGIMAITAGGASPELISYSISTGFSTNFINLVHFPGIRIVIPGYAGTFDVCDPDQDEMDGDRLWRAGRVRVLHQRLGRQGVHRDVPA